ncbi:e3 ubiquitin-protein ligase MYLIP [Caerostris darwini]|uniref:RING-type E3 ubiquitin transferase n=1 Tax=Caerostris darwini TaxID=1538125 RepID=A0AAV4MYF1_9ARAC|nr:e3 ubiquitin-protein ligase MYLIP [Caerostris darwini]
MLCLVRQADSVIIEVEVDSKAKGKQCLDKVCEVLGIIECDYMGLQYIGPHSENLWLNLRNQIRRQLPGPPPYRLQLRVKFFVPPHLVLQDITRHYFYLDVRRAFIENRLRATSTHQMCHITALIAQIELGDLEETVGSATALLHYHKYLPTNCIMNCSDDSERPPQLRVRWRSGGSTDANSNNHNNASDETPSDEEGQQVSIETDRTTMIHLCQKVLKEHLLLRGIKTSAVIYQFLKEASELEDFGMEQYFVKNRNGETLRIGVGPTGILIHDLNLQLKHNIPYASVHLATHAGRCFFLNFVNDCGDSSALGFKLENCHSASALYRAVTEKHAFYSCETVRNAVTSQYIRDLKGTIASLFNENTALGKNYVFDIQKTCREVYDHTRRVIYQMESVGKCKSKDPLDASDIGDANNSKEQGCHSSSCKDIQEQLAAFQDSMLCRICMDSDVSTVFFPCRHVACCSTCAPLCQNCPLCRSSISDTQHVYLPYTGCEISRFRKERKNSSPMNSFINIVS